MSKLVIPSIVANGGSGGGSYTAGTGIDISSNTISTKIDNSTIKTNENGQLYSESSIIEILKSEGSWQTINNGDVTTLVGKQVKSITFTNNIIKTTPLPYPLTIQDNFGNGFYIQQYPEGLEVTATIYHDGSTYWHAIKLNMAEEFLPDQEFTDNDGNLLATWTKDTKTLEFVNPISIANEQGLDYLDDNVSYYIYIEGDYIFPEPSENKNKLGRVIDTNNNKDLLVICNGTKWTFLPNYTLSLTGNEIYNIDETNPKYMGIDIEEGQIVNCTQPDINWMFQQGYSYYFYKAGSTYYLQTAFDRKQNTYQFVKEDLSDRTDINFLYANTFISLTITDLGTYGCHIIVNGPKASIFFTTGNTLPQALDIITNDYSFIEYYLNGKKVNNIIFEPNTSYSVFTEVKLDDNWNTIYIAYIYDNKDNNAGIVLQANNNTTINSYQVPQLTADQITQAYNGLVAGKQVVITDTTGLMHFAVNQADVVSGEPIISFEYFDIMELTYLTDGTIEYRTHNNQITLTQEQYDALTSYADHTDYRIIE